MNLMYLLWIVILASWFLGIVVSAFHVTKYSTPKDKLILSFLTFIGISGAALFWAISFVGEVL